MKYPLYISFLSSDIVRRSLCCILRISALLPQVPWFKPGALRRFEYTCDHSAFHPSLVSDLVSVSGVAPCKVIRIPESRKHLFEESGIQETFTHGIQNPEDY